MPWLRVNLPVAQPGAILYRVELGIAAHPEAGDYTAATAMPYTSH